MRTEVLISPAGAIRLANWSVRAGFGRSRNAIRAIAAGHERGKNAGRLTPSTVAEFATRQSSKVGKDKGRRTELAISDETMARPVSELRMQQAGAALLLSVLKAEPAITTVANVGARVDVVSAYLAQKYPAVEFVSVDLQPDLREHNAALPHSPNWRFLSGYALDLFETGTLTADTVFMTSTSVLFNNRELDDYVRAMAVTGVRRIVLNEPWWPRAGALWPLLIRPEDIPGDDPRCLGLHGNYHHNYIAKLSAAGFSVKTSRIISTRETYAALQIVASR